MLSYFKNPGIGLALGIKAATSRSAVQRSTNGVNSAWIKRELPYYHLFHPNLVPRASLYPIFWSARDWDSNNKEPGQPVLIVVPNTAFIVTVHEYLVASFFFDQVSFNLYFQLSKFIVYKKTDAATV